VRILGIDCGTVLTGYGIIDTDGTRHVLVEAGSIETPAKAPFEQRLLVIGRRLRELIAAHRPEAAAVEEVFHAVNTRTALKLTHVRGVALFVAAEAGLRVGEYSPATIKMSVTGYGRADKAQIQWMVRSLLKLNAPLESEDAADACAAAICHAVHSHAGVAG
jgi:crossover junction endodeoxyribonuclease RuvC